MQKIVNQIYYYIKPFIHRRLQIILRRIHVKIKLLMNDNCWPIYENTSKRTQCCIGWPGKKKFALILTHDVDTIKGARRCIQLMEMEKSIGLRSSFNFVPEGYQQTESILKSLENNGYEIGIHGLNHDGKLFRSKKEFIKRAKKINYYIENFKAVGFRAPAMHHNLEWIHALNIEYDASTFDADPFEPQPEGCHSIYPFWVHNGSGGKGYIELPYTLPQDYTAFVLMKDMEMELWKKKLEWIVSQGGMALLNTHPDYMAFGHKKPRFDEYPAEKYQEFLEYIKRTYEDCYWNVLPREIAHYWKTKMVTEKGGIN